ncbi:hypothetical protein IWW57_001564 [Coemansia sp. S610]|nr:hypothetical protein IWW57_001564 [Coemansia sp. S610]
MVGMSLYPPNSTESDLASVELGQLRVSSRADLDFMSKAGRAAATTIHSQLQALRPHLLLQHALDIPDFTLNITPVFYTTRTTVTTPEDITGGDTVTYQALSMASRPRIVSFIRDKIVYLGQTRQRFRGLTASVSLSPLSAEEQMGLVRFSDPVDDVCLDDEGEQNMLTSPVASPLSPMASTRHLMMTTIGGPRHIGKSHIMLQVAALFASEPSVIVLYIGSSSDLVLSGSDGDRVKYIQFVEHVVRASTMYPEVTRLADRWYKATRMGTDVGAMGVATTVFMRELSELCAERDIDIVLFLDDFEALADVDPLLAVINIHILIERLGVIVVATSSASALPSSQHNSHQCIVTAALTPDEAMDVFFATHAHLDISDTGLERIFEAAEYHPLDIAQMLAQYENKLASLGNVDEARVIGSLIGDGEFARNLRITQMHLRYLRESLSTAAQTARPVEYGGMSREIISVEQSPQLLRVKSEITRAAFAIFHGLEPKHCLGRDLQFAEPETIVTPNVSYVRCFPPSAAEIMYRAHFSGTSAEEQFQWLFDSTTTKFDVEPRLRLRYFDALLLDSGRIRGSARKLDGGGHDLDIRFAHVVSFAGKRGQRIEPRLCTTFAEASEVVAKYIETLRERAPTYEPVESRKEVRSAGAMLYFPRLGFGESWMPADVQSRSHYDGSIMAAVVRVDRLLDDKAEWGSAEFEVTWISNDPLSPATTRSVGNEPGLMSKGDPDAAPESAVKPPPKDIADLDAIYGVGGSWSAKSLRIFRDLQPPTDHTATRMLAIAADKRFAEIASGDVARVLGSSTGAGRMSAIGASALGHRVYSQMTSHI